MDHCRKCGALGADASGRCWDCVSRDFTKAEMEQADKRSVYKIRDIEALQDKPSVKP